MSVELIESDGGRLAVELRGSSSNGPLVVCTPALGDSRSAYAPLADQLVAAGYRVALVDLRGHGDSSVAGFRDYGDEATARDTAAAITAGQHPDLVAGIMLFGGFLRNPIANPFLGALARGFLNLLLWRPWGPSAWKMYASSLWPGLGPAGAQARAVETTTLLTRPTDKDDNATTTKTRWAAFQATVAGADHSVVGPWLAKVRHQPALVVVGDKDPDWSDPVAEAAWVASQFAQSTTLVVPGAGHAPMLENPALVGPAVLQFLGTLQTGDTFKASTPAA
ncbi:Alpha/beta hydrolase [Niveomyces insectorum RCEF 264]|uniref:Alpha/beta hydrolase n=1 Tax=Niveomyces insectorum RCEF 264 TaxID=1081102 RepID=A0A167QVI4_9HYPO|nr:Alpha/beta hydrolase [Niveomyces insectorum RCEF 264]